jgi:hypothetical protein
MLYPSPIKDFVNAEYFLQESKDVFIEVYSTKGETLYKNVIDSGITGKQKINLNLEFLKSGFYIIVFKTSKDVLIQKIEKN